MLNLALLPVLLLRISRLWIGNKRNENSDSELNDFFLSTVPAQYFRPNDSENGDDSTKNCLATNVIITSPRRCTQRLINNVYSLYRETSYPIIKTNILSKIHDDCLKNVTARVLTKFSADLAR